MIPVIALKGIEPALVLMLHKNLKKLDNLFNVENHTCSAAACAIPIDDHLIQVKVHLGPRPAVRERAGVYLLNSFHQVITENVLSEDICRLVRLADPIDRKRQGGPIWRVW